jgi:hypothetical protein
MAADESKALVPLWRFSLRSLLLLTAAIALLLWAYISGWRLDDLIYLTAWFASVLVGIVFSRRGGWGIVLAIVLAALVPTAGFLAFHYYLYYVRRLVIQTEAFYPVTLLATALGGAMTAAIVVTAVVLYDRCSPAIRRRIGICVKLAIAFAGLAIGILGIRTESRRWRPTIVIPLLIDHYRPAPPPMAFTPNGSTFAMVTKHATNANSELRLWNLDANTERKLCELPGITVLTICFSADGRRIAVVHAGGISVYDTQSGNEAVSIDDVVTHNPWIPRNCCFSPDGKLLALCSYNGEDHHAFVWDTSNWELRHQHKLDEISQPVAVSDELMLLAFTPGEHAGLTLHDVGTLEPRYPPRFLNRLYRPLLSPDGMRAASAADSVDLPSGKLQPLRGTAFCLASGGRRFVTRRADMKENQFDHLPDWRLGIPVVRKWWRMREYVGELVLVDLASQQELGCTPNYRGEWLIEAISSADGKWIAGTFEPGTVRLWRVPD